MSSTFDECEHNRITPEERASIIKEILDGLDLKVRVIHNDYRGPQVSVSLSFKGEPVATGNVSVYDINRF